MRAIKTQFYCMNLNSINGDGMKTIHSVTLKAKFMHNLKTRSSHLLAAS